MADAVDIAPYMEGLFLTAGLADWAQTRKIARDPVRHIETNPVLGEHPSQRKVNAYMPIAGLLQYAGYKSLPDNLKLPYALATSLAEANVVRQNVNTGLGLNTPALLLGAALTAYLANENNKDKAVSVTPTMIDKTPGLVFNRRF